MNTHNKNDMNWNELAALDRAIDKLQLTNEMKEQIAFCYAHDIVIQNGKTFNSTSEDLCDTDAEAMQDFLNLCVYHIQKARHFLGQTDFTRTNVHALERSIFEQLTTIERQIENHECWNHLTYDDNNILPRFDALKRADANQQ